MHTFRKITAGAQSRNESHTFQRRKMNQQSKLQDKPTTEVPRALSHYNGVGGDRADFRVVWGVQVTRPQNKTKKKKNLAFWNSQERKVLTERLSCVV